MKLASMAGSYKLHYTSFHVFLLKMFPQLLVGLPTPVVFSRVRTVVVKVRNFRYTALDYHLEVAFLPCHPIVGCNMSF